VPSVDVSRAIPTKLVADGLEPAAYMQPRNSSPRNGRGTLCRVPAFPYCEILLRQQKKPESESVRDQEQRHYQSRKEECGSQLPRQQSGVIGLLESIEKID
jgi:hypothetical protein